MLFYTDYAVLIQFYFCALVEMVVKASREMLPIKINTFPWSRFCPTKSKYDVSSDVTIVVHRPIGACTNLRPSFLWIKAQVKKWWFRNFFGSAAFHNLPDIICQDRFNQIGSVRVRRPFQMSLAKVVLVLIGLSPPHHTQTHAHTSN